jgi:amino acid transporter, AAT family
MRTKRRVRRIGDDPADGLGGASGWGGTGRAARLSHRQIQLIAIGGAIGVGLFLGAGKAIGDAGPAVLLCYAGAGAIVFLMLRALGEMAVERPISGSFARYAGREVGRWASFATG